MLCIADFSAPDSSTRCSVLESEWLTRGGAAEPGAGEPSWYLSKRTSMISPALPSAWKGSAAAPRASRQQAFGCLIDESS